MWDFITGLGGLPGRQGEASRNPLAALDGLNALPPEAAGILVLKDFHRYCEDASICRRLRNLASDLRQVPRTLVITASQWQLPSDLQDCITQLDLPPPEAAEIRALLASIAEACGQRLEETVLDELSQGCCGLSEQRIRQVAARGLARRG